MVPVLGLRNPERTLKRVVFPEPFGPMRPMISPLSTEKEISERMRCSPMERERWLVERIDIGQYSTSHPYFPVTAFINPSNNGCGRCGRLLNSGWNCEPTMNG